MKCLMGVNAQLHSQKKTMLNGKTCLKESVGSELEQSKPIGFSAYQKKKVITPLHRGGTNTFMTVVVAN